MFDMSWGELAFLAVLALVVVGPRDLPRLAKFAGQMMTRVQRIYRDSVFNLHRLESEIELAQSTDRNGRPSYHTLLPEHVQRHLQETSPAPVPHAGAASAPPENPDTGAELKSFKQPASGKSHAVSGQ